MNKKSTVSPVVGEEVGRRSRRRGSSRSCRRGGGAGDVIEMHEGSAGAGTGGRTTDTRRGRGGARSKATEERSLQGWAGLGVDALI